MTEAIKHQEKLMIKKGVGSIEWLEFSLLQQLPLKHGISLRQGGVSSPPFDSLNMGSNVQDDLEHVLENRKRMAAALGMPPIQFASQEHGTTIVPIEKYQDPPTADVLTTNVVGLAIAVCHADCQAAILYDPKTHSLSAVHAGWRGNVQNIYQVAIADMAKRYGTDPKDLLVCISPSLGPKEAEFLNYKKEFPEELWLFETQDCHFDLWRVARWQLQQAGVHPDHIQLAEVCTKENEGYFSYRRNRKTGRHATIACLQPTPPSESTP